MNKAVLNLMSSQCPPASKPKSTSTSNPLPQHLLAMESLISVNECKAQNEAFQDITVKQMCAGGLEGMDLFLIPKIREMGFAKDKFIHFHRTSARRARVLWKCMNESLAEPFL